MDDHLPAAEIIHDVASPSGDRLTEALSLTRQAGRWSQHLYSVLGRRHGRLVEVHVVQSFDRRQETGPKGYLEDDEVVWRIEAICFPVEDKPATPFAMTGDTVVANGRYCLELGTGAFVWVVSEPGEGSSLLASAYLLPWGEPRVPDARVRLTVRRDGSEASTLSTGWTEAPGPCSTAGSRQWRRRIGDDLIEVDVCLAGDAPALRSLSTLLLDSFWIA